jgi:hypothetical protein
VNDASKPESEKNLMSIFPNVAMTLSAATAANYESVEVGINWNNFNQPYNNYRFSMGCLFLLIDFFFYGILAIYLENVLLLV